MRTRLGARTAYATLLTVACLLLAACTTSAEEPSTEAEPSDGSTFEMHAAAKAAAKDLEKRLELFDAEDRGRFRYVVEHGSSTPVDLDAEYDRRARSLRYEGTVTDAGRTFEMRALVVGGRGWVNSPEFGTGASGCWLAMDEDTARASASNVTGGLVDVLESVRFGTSDDEAVGYLPLELAVRLLPTDALRIPADLGYTRSRVPVDVTPKGQGLSYSIDLEYVSRALVGISAIPPRRQASLRGYSFTAEGRPGGVDEPFRRPRPEDVITLEDIRVGACEVV